MKHLLLAILLATTSQACLPPLIPLPPLGCFYDDAMLVVVSDTECYWVFVNCGGL